MSRVELLKPRSGTRGPYWPRVFRIVYQSYFLLFFFAALALMTDEGILRFPVRLLFHADPLTAISTLLSSFVLPSALLISWAVVLLTVAFGRAFCGWICPLGTLNHLAAWVTRGLRRAPPEVENRWRPHFALKYLLLVGLLVVALSGSLLVGLFDPLSFAARSFGSALTPALGRLLGFEAERPRVFAGAWITGALFLGILVANRWIVRWWCRALCPLGALLGWVARAAIFRIHVDPVRCNECHECAADCQGADEPFDRHRVSECHVCLNCVSRCPEQAISFQAFAPEAAPKGGIDLPRRQVLGAALSGLAIVPLLRATEGSASSPGPLVIRPPGALPETEFLARCVRCGACVNACPTAALQPALGTAGFEGLYTPILVPRRGWCEPSCIRCGHVCPTGAIRPLAADEKRWTGDGSAIRIGTAFLEHGRCLPWSMATPCVVCQEVCPTSPKSIWLEPVEAVRGDGSVVSLQRPQVDPARCVGCGLCEAKCPVADVAAIRITRIGESRDPGAALTLRDRT